jgi:hypothetical protein
MVEAVRKPERRTSIDDLAWVSLVSDQTHRYTAMRKLAFSFMKHAHVTAVVRRLNTTRERFFTDPYYEATRNRFNQTEIPAPAIDRLTECLLLFPFQGTASLSSLEKSFLRWVAMGWPRETLMLTFLEAKDVLELVEADG